MVTKRNLRPLPPAASTTERAPRSASPLFRAWLSSRPIAWVMVPLFCSLLLTPVVLVLSSAGAGALPVVLAIGSFIFMLLVTIALVMARVTVGPEGVLIERIGERRFVSFASIERAAEVEGRIIRLAIRGGAPVDIYTGREENTGKANYEELCHALLARIEEGRARYHEAAGDDDRARSAERLLARLRAAGPATSSAPPVYRDAAAPSRDELWEALDDPNAPVTARAAAAALLSREAGDGERQRLRIAADGTADPALRRLVRIAADTTDDAAIEDEIEALAKRGTIEG